MGFFFGAVNNAPAAAVATQGPAWLLGTAANQWVRINNSAGPSGVVVNAWGGVAIREDISEICYLCQGGHNDSSDNRVSSLLLEEDEPAWVLRNAPTPANELIEQSAYNADGKPSSRHVYQHNHWIPSRNRYMMFGLRGLWPGSGTSPTVDGFDPDTDAWDPAGTYADTNPAGMYAAVRERYGSDVWMTNIRKWTAATDTYSNPLTSKVADLTRWPQAHDTLRNQIFTFQFGDGQGFNPELGIQATKFSINGTRNFAVTINSSTARDEFVAEVPVNNVVGGYTYIAMDYDEDYDRFLVYTGAVAGKVYVITPNETNAWDMSVLATTGTPQGVSVSGTPGINRRFVYVPRLKGFVLHPSTTADLWFLPTSLLP